MAAFPDLNNIYVPSQARVDAQLQQREANKLAILARQDQMARAKDDAARQGRKRNAFAANAGDPRGQAAAVAGDDPELSFKLMEHVRQLDAGERDRQMKEAGLVAQAFANLPDDPNAYAQTVQALRMAGVDKPFPEYQPGIGQAMARLSGATVKAGNLVAAEDPQGNPVFIQQTGQGVRSVPGYRPPTKQAHPGAHKKVLDRASGQLVFATDEMIAATPDRFAPAPSGMRIESGPDGQFSVVTGDMAGQSAGLDKATNRNIEGRIVDTTEKLARVRATLASWRPEFSTFGGQGRAFWAALKDKAQVGQVTDQERSFLEGYTQWSATAFEDLNATLKEMSGAAVNEHEMRRLRKQLPDPNRDSPIEFQQKAARLQKSVMMALARLTYFRKQGLPATAQDFSRLTLGDFESDVFNRRGDEIFQAFKAQGFDDERAANMTDHQLRAEFGVSL